MPSLIKSSIKIISDAGLGMAMFSLGTLQLYINIITYTIHIYTDTYRQTHMRTSSVSSIDISMLT